MGGEGLRRLPAKQHAPKARPTTHHRQWPAGGVPGRPSSANGCPCGPARLRRAEHSRLTAGHRCPTCTTSLGAIHVASTPEGGLPPDPPPKGRRERRPKERSHERPSASRGLGGRTGTGGLAPGSGVRWGRCGRCRLAGWRLGRAAVQVLLEVGGDAAGDLMQVGGSREQAGQAVQLTSRQQVQRAGGNDSRASKARSGWPLSWVYVALPTSQHTNLPPLLEGSTVRLASRHAKVRREGYRRRQMC